VRGGFADGSASGGRLDLDLYAAGTRAMLAGRVITPAQMDDLARD